MGCFSIGGMNINIQSTDQLEMAFNSNVRCSSEDRRRQRRERAAAWFQRMRHVVERAVDWTPAPEPPPMQIWFPEPARIPAPRRAQEIAFPAPEQNAAVAVATVAPEQQMAA